AIDSKRSLSQASEALEISSRRKISLCEYSEWVTRCRTWATSASKARVSAWVSVFVVMEAFRIAWPWRRGYARSGGDFKAGGGLLAGSGGRLAGSQRDSRGRARDGARVRRMAADEAVLYLVHVDAGVARHPDPSPDLVELAPGLYL